MADTSNAQIVVIVRFKSRLPREELERRYKERLPEFQKLEGLLQKFYVFNEATEEWGGIYIWESPAHAKAYMESDLRKSIGPAYEVDGEPRVERLKVETTLR